MFWPTNSTNYGIGKNRRQTSSIKKQWWRRIIEQLVKAETLLFLFDRKETNCCRQFYGVIGSKE